MRNLRTLRLSLPVIVVLGVTTLGCSNGGSADKGTASVTIGNEQFEFDLTACESTALGVGTHPTLGVDTELHVSSTSPNRLSIDWAASDQTNDNAGWFFTDNPVGLPDRFTTGGSFGPVQLPMYEWAGIGADVYNVGEEPNDVVREMATVTVNCFGD